MLAFEIEKYRQITDKKLDLIILERSNAVVINLKFMIEKFIQSKVLND